MKTQGCYDAKSDGGCQVTGVGQGGDGRDGCHGPVSAEWGWIEEEPAVDKAQVHPMELSVRGGEGHSWIVVTCVLCMLCVCLLCVCMHVYMCAYMLCVHVCVYACLHVCIYVVCTCVYVCVFTCVCIHVCMYACVHVCVYVVCTCVYACLHVCMYAC